MQVAQATELARATGRKTGPAGAVILSAGFGSFVLGLTTVLAQASTSVNGLLNWWNPAGPLTGKAGVAVAAWLVVWAVLHFAWRGRDVNFGRLWIASIVLTAIGFMGTFPPVFEAF